jgi:hypothetical protein
VYTSTSSFACRDRLTFGSVALPSCLSKPTALPFTVVPICSPATGAGPVGANACSVAWIDCRSESDQRRPPSNVQRSANLYVTSPKTAFCSTSSARVRPKNVLPPFSNASSEFSGSNGMGPPLPSVVTTCTLNSFSSFW